MMRKSRRGRWLVHGVLAATAIAGVVTGSDGAEEPDDFSWGASVATSSIATVTDQYDVVVVDDPAGQVESFDFSWG
jgi:hypothetical protein